MRVIRSPDASGIFGFALCTVFETVTGGLFS
jgi:hypothetical protein